MGTKQRTKMLEGMKQALYTDAVLMCDVPEHRPEWGDIVKLLNHHVAPYSKEGYSTEIFNAVGGTVAITAVPSIAIERLREDEIVCAWLITG